MSTPRQGAARGRHLQRPGQLRGIAPGDREGQLGDVSWRHGQLGDIAFRDIAPPAPRASPAVPRGSSRPRLTASRLGAAQGSQVSIYRSDQGYRRVEGYPRALLDELGVTSADAAFTCPRSEKLYVISGNSLRLVNLLETPRRAEAAVPLPHAHVDGALCTADGLFLFCGPNYHKYQGVEELLGATQPAPPRNVSTDFFHCPQ
nr:hemopexin [Dromaius novaehollandiae]